MKRGLHKIALFLLLLLGLIAINSCKSKTVAAHKKVAIIVSTLNNPWFVFLAKNAAAKAKELGYETRIFDSQNNTALKPIISKMHLLPVSMRSYLIPPMQMVLLQTY